MAKTPSGHKRPANVIGNAVRVMQIATGQADESPAQSLKSKAGKAGGKRGGKSRAAALSPRERADIAKKAAAARWGKK